VEGEKIILMSLNNLSESDGYKLFESAQKLLSKTNDVQYIPVQEYYLLQEGMSKETLYKYPLSDSLKAIISLHTECRYIIEIEILESKRGGTFGSYTASELDKYNAHYYQGNETNSASLFFTITDTQSTLIENRFQVNTTIGSLIIKEADGEARINTSTRFSAISASFEKGIKRIKKGVIKN
jgi:hypothetical protein